MIHYNIENNTIINHTSETAHRDSNLELFRIITMLLIVSHHYVVNSGLMDNIRLSPLANQSIFLLLFGAVNCKSKCKLNCV